ncbi:VOC family protein [Endozoicomonas arenosclerae]|uniref:VOC family protein n=1 Tax=Endozoicomonas arenosclerae TaxID=1633495 RepID=UPI00078580D5|nr:VOC family protein [Endozoicomonas arenosclerae]
MLKILGIDHVVLRTDRLEAMLDFYCNLLGCTVERQTSEETGLYQLRAGNALIDLVTVTGAIGRAGGEAPGATGRNMDHFCLLIEKMSEQSLVDYLVSKGVDAGEMKKRYGSQGQGLSLYINDPDGNAVELKPSLQ